MKLNSLKSKTFHELFRARSYMIQPKVLFGTMLFKVWLEDQPLWSYPVLVRNAVFRSISDLMSQNLWDCFGICVLTSYQTMERMSHYRLLEPAGQNGNFVGMRWGLVIWISKKFSRDVDSTHLWTTVKEALLWSRSWQTKAGQIWPAACFHK